MFRFLVSIKIVPDFLESALYYSLYFILFINAIYKDKCINPNMYSKQWKEIYLKNIFSVFFFCFCRIQFQKVSFCSTYIFYLE